MSLTKRRSPAAVSSADKRNCKVVVGTANRFDAQRRASGSKGGVPNAKRDASDRTGLKRGRIIRAAPLAKPACNPQTQPTDNEEQNRRPKYDGGID